MRVDLRLYDDSVRLGRFLPLPFPSPKSGLQQSHIALARTNCSPGQFLARAAQCALFARFSAPSPSARRAPLLPLLPLNQTHTYAAPHPSTKASKQRLHLTLHHLTSAAPSPLHTFSPLLAHPLLLLLSPPHHLLLAGPQLSTTCSLLARQKLRARQFFPRTAKRRPREAPG